MAARCAELTLSLRSACTITDGVVTVASTIGGVKSRVQTDGRARDGTATGAGGGTSWVAERDRVTGPDLTVVAARQRSSSSDRSKDF